MPTINPGSATSDNDPINNDFSDISLLLMKQPVGAQTSTTFTIRDPAPDDYLYTFAGTGFSGYQANGLPSAGTVTSIEFKTGAGGVYFSITGLSASVPALRAALTANDAVAFNAILFGGADTLNGSAFDDTLLGHGGADTIIGGAGDDILWGGPGSDFVSAGAGDDAVIVSTNEIVVNELMDGGVGFDILVSGGANVDFRGAIISNFEAIQFVPELGTETALNAMFNASQLNGMPLALSGLSITKDSVQIFVASGGSVSTANWTFTSEWQFQDYIVYVGDAGNEQFIGFPGLDIFFGSPGNDTFTGGGATDFAAYLFSPNAVTADLAIAGAQSIGGNQGFDTFIGLEGLAGSQLNDTLFGDNNSNFLLGVHGDDVLVGRGGNDDIRGGEHADRIEGGSGADILWGAQPADVMSGPDGADTFVYRNAAEGGVTGDTIMDFQAGIDRIEVSASGFGGGLVAGGAVTLIASASPTAQGNGGQFLYNTGTGQVFWDADGAGAGVSVLLATLATRPTLTAASFVVTPITGASAAEPVLESMKDSAPSPEISLDTFSFDEAPAVFPAVFFADNGLLPL